MHCSTLFSFRHRHLIAVLLLSAAAGSVSKAAGQNQKSPSPAEIRSIEAEETANGVKVDIDTSGTLNPPSVSHLSNPARLVFDFPGAIPKLTKSRIVLNKRHLLSIRAARFLSDNNPAPITRVVFDLDQRVEYQTNSQPGKFVVTLTEAPTTASPKTIAPNQSPAKSPVTEAVAPIEKKRATSTGQEINKLSGIQVSETVGSLSISLELDRAAVPQISRLSNPSRVVLDFPDTSFSANWKQPGTITVNVGEVKTLRTALFKKDPPILRVVLDENRIQLPTISSEGSNVILRFAGATTIATRATPPKPAIAQTRSPGAVAKAVAPRLSARMGLSARAPIVTYKSGFLTLNADNSKLADVLRAIAEQTGAQIEIPNTPDMQDFLVLKMGPARPVDVIQMALQASSYECNVFYNNDGILRQIVLIPK